MTKPARRFVSLAAVLVLSFAASHALADHIDDVIRSEMAQRHIPGVALAVIGGGRIIREQSYGFADEEHKVPVTASTVFQAASVSKPVAAIGALHLVDEGKVFLDEDINRRLKSWRIFENRFTREHPVTLRLILSQSAGLTVHGFRGYRVGDPIPSLLQILDGKPPASSAPIRVERIPGRKWDYSGGGYLVMQQMMIDATGKPFADYMDETVFKPFGMTSSTFVQPLPAPLEQRAATGYTGAPIFMRARPMALATRASRRRPLDNGRRFGPLLPRRPAVHGGDCELRHPPIDESPDGSSAKRRFRPRIHGRRNPAAVWPQRE